MIPVMKMLLNVRKGIKIQPHQLSPTQLKPSLSFSDIYEDISHSIQEHEVTLQPVNLQGTLAHVKRVRASNMKTFGYGKFWDPVLTLIQPVRHVQIRTGTCLAIRVKKLLVHLLEQQRPWSWLHLDASLAGKKDRQKTCCSGYASATSSRSIFFFQYSRLH